MSKFIAVLLAVVLVFNISILSAASEKASPDQELPGGNVNPPYDFGTNPTYDWEPEETQPTTFPTLPFGTEPTEETEPAEETEPTEETEATDPTEETEPTEATEPTETTAATTEATEPTGTQAATESTAGGEEDEDSPFPLCLILFCGAAVLMAGIIVVLLVTRKTPRNKQAPANSIPLLLEVLEGKCRDNGKTIYLTRELLIGSDPACDVVFKEESVSPRHCRIFVQDNLVYLEDLNDRSATAIEGMKIYAPNRLRSEDEITLGAVRFKLLF